MILCGSIYLWIDDNVLNSTGFFGRISLELALEELSLAESNILLNDLPFTGSAYEKFKILSITGGIPWYLEHIQSNKTANENIQKLCFTKDALLVKEFEKIFNDLFDHKGTWYRKIVAALVNGPLEYNAIYQTIGYQSSGRITEYLNNLVTAGFVSRDHSWNLKSLKKSRLSKYRLCDNYLRFYLKYIEPNYNKIQKNQFTYTSMQAFPGWNAILSLQFENLVLNNRANILTELGIKPEDIQTDNPFFQTKTSKQQGCQIDYLIQTRYNTLFACEIKFSKNRITKKIITEMQNKLQRLVIPKNFSCFPVLIHVNGVSDEVEDSNHFAKIIDFSDLL